MKALLLAAGRGSRLGKITELIPKPLVKINNKPVIDYLIRKLMNLNVTGIIINTNYKNSLIEEYVTSMKYNVELSLSYEPKLLGTAGTLKKHIDELSTDDFIVMHADNYFQDDLENLKKTHLLDKSRHLLTMGTFVVSDPTKFGTVLLSKDETVIGYLEKDKNSPSKIANSAIYFMSSEIKNEVNKLNSDEIDISINLLPKLVGKIKACPLQGYFYDIGTPDNLLTANSLSISLD
jgi:mannose-1-phosphate guanylyltransferase